MDLETGNFEFENYGERDQIVSDEEFEATSDAHLRRILPSFDLPKPNQKQHARTYYRKTKSMHVFYRLCFQRMETIFGLRTRQLPSGTLKQEELRESFVSTKMCMKPNLKLRQLRLLKKCLIRGFGCFPGGFLVLRDHLLAKQYPANKKEFPSHQGLVGPRPEQCRLGSIEKNEQKNLWTYLILVKWPKRSRFLDRTRNFSETSSELEILKVLADEYVR